MKVSPQTNKLVSEHFNISVHVCHVYTLSQYQGKQTKVVSVCIIFN